jgi:hypothetical protein
MMVDMFHWPLCDMDATAIESLIPFLFRYPHWKSEQKDKPTNQKVFADQVGWL